MINTILLTNLTLNAHALSLPEGYSLMKKENTRILRLLVFLCGWLVSSALLQYYGYCDNPIYSIRIRMTALSETALMSCFHLKALVQC